MFSFSPRYLGHELGHRVLRKEEGVSLFKQAQILQFMDPAISITLLHFLVRDNVNWPKKATSNQPHFCQISLAAARDITCKLGSFVLASNALIIVTMQNKYLIFVAGFLFF